MTKYATTKKEAVGLLFLNHFGESAPDIGIRVPRPVPVDVASIIVKVTGVDEVAIGRALVRNTRPCHTHFVPFLERLHALISD